MMTTKESQLDYFMDVVLRSYCRTSEENEFLYEELDDLRGAFSVLLTENSELKFKLQQAGIEVPASDFTEIDTA